MLLQAHTGCFNMQETLKVNVMLGQDNVRHLLMVGLTNPVQSCHTLEYFINPCIQQSVVNDFMTILHSTVNTTTTTLTTTTLLTTTTSLTTKYFHSTATAACGRPDLYLSLLRSQPRQRLIYSWLFSL